MLFALLLALGMIQMPQSQTLTAVQNLTITDAAPNVTIYYTTNGSTPTVDSPKYEHPINLTQSCTVQAFAMDNQGDVSPIASASYTFEAQPPAITSSAGTVTITTPTAGADIFYTTAGNLPTTSSTLYTGPFTAASGTTIRAISAETGWTASAVTSYTVP